MNKNDTPDYLKTLFAQETSDLFTVKTNTPNPAITGVDMAEILSKMQMGFLNDYLQKGDTSRIFHKEGSGTHFFYNYDCPNIQSKAQELADSDNEDDFLDFEEGQINIAETLGLDLTTPLIAVGIDIVFNEDTALYQVDSAYIKPTHQENVTSISCGQDNAPMLGRLMRELCPLVMRVVNGEELAPIDMAVLWPFYAKAAKSAPGNTRPATP